jgi:hypothetical protein
MADGDTLVNAVLGAVISVVLTPLVPFAPVVGGTLAGYLEGGDRDAGLRVGALSGGIALVPLFLLGILLASVFLFVLSGGFGVPRAAGGLGLVVLSFGAAFVAVYTIGLSAVGGWLGNYVRYDTDLGRGGTDGDGSGGPNG